jgi:5-methylcytosine-specific restriction endonuclease McrA
MKKENEALYKSIAKRSFKTKLNLYSFKMALRCESEEVKLDVDDFNNFTITHELIEQCTAEYWQTERDNKIYGKIVDDIYKWIKLFKEKNNAVVDLLKANYVQNFNQVFTESDFESLLQNKKSCHYCGITIDLVEKLAAKKKLYKKNERGWSLEIDRVNSNFEYSEANCVMSCYWCNNAKTDEFTAEEFTVIGKAIAQVWYERITKSNIIGDFYHLKHTK